jgi:hypothetical protein
MDMAKVFRGKIGKASAAGTIVAVYRIVSPEKLVLVVRRPYVIEYVAANDMTLAFYPYGKYRFNFQHLCILTFIENMLTPAI